LIQLCLEDERLACKDRCQDGDDGGVVDGGLCALLVEADVGPTFSERV
jgi:hypothetical protein